MIESANGQGADRHRVRGAPRRSRCTVGQDGWEEVADYALEWAAEHGIEFEQPLVSDGTVSWR